jgi:catechol 2,3-dioxygenase-like lactoylglutathione lyase family enzyme
MTDPTVPTAVGQVALLVRDVEASIAFYRDTLGLEHFGTWGDLVFFKAGATRVFCTRVEEAAWTPLSTVYFAVADLVGAVARLEAAGVTVTCPPTPIHTHEDGTEEWMAFLADPAGNTLALMTTRQKS